MSAGISLIPLTLAIVVHISLRGKRISDVTKEGALRFTPEELEAIERKKEDVKSRTIYLRTFIWSHASFSFPDPHMIVDTSLLLALLCDTSQFNLAG